MQEMYRLLIGAVILILGYPMGIILAKLTKEELKYCQRWFRLLIYLSLGVGVVGLIIKNDILMFACFFIAIVTSKSLLK